MKTVLLHGLGQTAQDWKEVVRQLSTSRVECPELFSATGDEISYFRILANLERQYSSSGPPTTGACAGTSGQSVQKFSGFGKLPNKHFHGPAACENFGVWPYPNCLPFCATPENGAKKRRPLFWNLRFSGFLEPFGCGLHDNKLFLIH